MNKDAFISYAREDGEFAERLDTALKLKKKIFGWINATFPPPQNGVKRYGKVSFHRMR
jgi:hypothetical protein